MNVDDTPDLLSCHVYRRIPRAKVGMFQSRKFVKDMYLLVMSKSVPNPIGRNGAVEIWYVSGME